MKRHPNHRLITMMKRFKLTQMQAAELCRCGRTAVYYWTRDPKHKDFTKMSDTHQRLLELELRLVEPAGNPNNPRNPNNAKNR